jgi:hypothetical protein
VDEKAKRTGQQISEQESVGVKVFPEEKLPIIFKLRRKGVPAKEIAAQIGLPLSTVVHAMKAHGISYPVGQGRRKATV